MKEIIIGILGVIIILTLYRSISNLKGKAAGIVLFFANLFSIGISVNLLEEHIISTRLCAIFVTVVVLSFFTIIEDCELSILWLVVNTINVTLGLAGTISLLIEKYHLPIWGALTMLTLVSIMIYATAIEVKFNTILTIILFFIIGISIGGISNYMSDETTFISIALLIILCIFTIIETHRSQYPVHKIDNLKMIDLIKWFKNPTNIKLLKEYPNVEGLVVSGEALKNFGVKPKDNICLQILRADGDKILNSRLIEFNSLDNTVEKLLSQKNIIRNSYFARN